MVQRTPGASKGYLMRVYAISHAATSLLIKRRFPAASLWALLVSVQAIELLWVVFVYAGIERPVYTRDSVHLGFLPYSHSVGSTVVIAVLTWAWIKFGRNSRVVAIAVAIGILSHVLLDIVHHERDIAIIILNILDLPLMFPRPGTGAMLAQYPAVLPTIILTQILLTWWAVARLARRARSA
jgi:hypothetical protein